MGFSDNRIAVRYCYESQSTTGRWYRSYGNENWEFESNGLMSVRHSSINDVEISASERQFHWELGTARPEGHPGLTELGLSKHQYGGYPDIRRIVAPYGLADL